MKERIEEDEGGEESKLEIKRKRENEMEKIRKLLEDVKIEYEENEKIMRKKNKEIVVELKEKIEKIEK